MDAELSDEDNLDAELSDEDNLDAELSDSEAKESTPNEDVKDTFIDFLKTLAGAINTTIEKMAGTSEETDEDNLDAELDLGEEGGSSDEQVFTNKDDLLNAVSSNEEEEEKTDDMGDGSLDDEMGNEDAGEFGEPDPNNPNPNLDGEDPLSNKPEVDEFQIEDDPDRQGNVHYVKSAHLVYRREQEDGTFEELWIYNVGDEAERKAEEIIRDILAGTDIDDTQIRSEDGAQEYTLWTIGNAQMLKITGLPA